MKVSSLFIDDDLIFIHVRADIRTEAIFSDQIHFASQFFWGFSSISISLKSPSLGRALDGLSLISKSMSLSFVVSPRTVEPKTAIWLIYGLSKGSAFFRISAYLSMTLFYRTRHMVIRSVLSFQQMVLKPVHCFHE